MWTPDVYQGSPASVTAFFALAPKIAAIALLGRLLLDVFGQLQAEWTQILYALSIASMALGALAGLAQKNIYRLLAYSSIGHIGYALLGFIAGGVVGFASTLSYIAIYMVMTAVTFALILSVRDKNHHAVTQLNDFMGLSAKSRFVPYALALVMFSMAGIPPLAGFFGKLFVFTAIIESGHYVLAVVGVLSSVIACYYYLKIIKIMFFDNAVQDDGVYVQKSYVINWVAIPCFIFVVGFILFPDWLNYEATQAVLSLQ
jgi:NADH-quinone oxidoreductase subunit N